MMILPKTNGNIWTGHKLSRLGTNVRINLSGPKQLKAAMTPPTRSAYSNKGDWKKCGPPKDGGWILTKGIKKKCHEIQGVKKNAVAGRRGVIKGGRRTNERGRDWMKKCPAVEPQQASKTNIWARAEVTRKGFAGEKMLPQTSWALAAKFSGYIVRGSCA